MPRYKSTLVSISPGGFYSVKHLLCNLQPFVSNFPNLSGELWSRVGSIYISVKLYGIDPWPHVLITIVTILILIYIVVLAYIKIGSSL